MSERKKHEANAAGFAALISYAMWQGEGKTTKVALDDVYQMPPVRPEDGKFYYAAPCGFCTKKTPIAEDKSEGKVTITFTGLGSLAYRCYFCDEPTRAFPASIQPIQWK